MGSTIARITSSSYFSFQNFSRFQNGNSRTSLAMLMHTVAAFIPQHPSAALSLHQLTNSLNVIALPLSIFLPTFNVFNAPHSQKFLNAFNASHSQKFLNAFKIKRRASSISTQDSPSLTHETPFLRRCHFSLVLPYKLLRFSRIRFCRIRYLLLLKF